MDVFDFDDDADLQSPQSPPSSPESVAKPKAKIVPPSAPEPSVTPVPPAAGNSSSQPSEEASAAASAASNTTDTTITTTADPDFVRSNPLQGRGTRHGRAREKKAAEEKLRKELEQQLLLQQQQQQKQQLKRNRQEKNGVSPPNPKNNNGKRNSNNNQKATADNGNGDDDDWSLPMAPPAIRSRLSCNNNAPASAASHDEEDGMFAPIRKRRRINGKAIKNRNARLVSSKSNHESTTGFDDNDYDGGGLPSLSPPPLAMAASNYIINSNTNQDNNNNLSLSELIEHKLQQHERQQQRICPSPVATVSRKVRGAGQDVYAMQDAGNLQMIHDECAYLTSTIVGCPEAQIPSKAGIIESVSELALLLANTKTRRTLWGGEGGGMSTSTFDADNSSLEGILDVLRHTTTALAERFNSGSHFYALTNKLQRVDPLENDDNNGDGNGIEATKNTKKVLPRSNTNIVETYYKGLLLDSLTAIVSFLSWDCTVDNRASAFYQNVTAAKSLRKTILQHDGTLTAVLYIIRHADPMVSSILEAQIPPELFESESAISAAGNALGASKQLNGLSQSQNSDLSSMQQSPPTSKATTTSDGRGSVASSQDGDSISSAHTKEDPTVAGRRKRRRKKALEPIAEDGLVAMSFSGGAAETTNKGILTPPRSPPRVVFQQPEASSEMSRTKLSFTSDDALSSPPRNRSPLRRRGMRSPSRPGDDASSMNSCDSTLIKIHDRLSKTRLKFIQSALPEKEQQKKNKQHSGNSNTTHQCQGHRELPLAFGGKDSAGSAASIALKTLHRLLLGKEEGDERSCLDEVEAESPSRIHRQRDFMSPSSPGMMSPKAAMSEEDELMNNPLLQTNRILGESGVIPSLVQGMAETLSAVIEELDQTGANSSPPCMACLQHLHDKFQGLAPIVDNACLMHDDNRTDLCSVLVETGDYSSNSSGGSLVGSLVLFLKRWLQQKSPKKGKRGSNNMTTLLNEIGLSVLRTLTSLTHDNSLAAEQLAIRYCELSAVGKAAASSWSGVNVISQVLFSAVIGNESGGGNKFTYDTRIFCLNTLANVVKDEPHGDVRSALLSMKWPQAAGPDDNASNVLFLRWLTQWLLSQTESFRNAIMKGTFGGKNPDPAVSSSPVGASSKTNIHSQRELDKHENEQLTTAGNGCVLLACLLMDPPKSNAIRGRNTSTSPKKKSGSPRKNSTSSKTIINVMSMATVTQKIRELILSEMPLDDSFGGNGGLTGTTFIQNTLRAFSNFLYFEMGDLSVAVVGPVRKLILELEKIQVEVVT